MGYKYEERYQYEKDEKTWEGNIDKMMTNRKNISKVKMVPFFPIISFNLKEATKATIGGRAKV